MMIGKQGVMVDLDSLRAWALQFVPGGVEVPRSPVLDAITGDAGFRQYFRLNTSPSLIAVFAPPAHENNPAFVAKGLALRRAGVHVPEIHAVNFECGYMLLEDLGDQLLRPLLDRDTMPRLYAAAEQSLRQVQLTPPDPAIFPAYSTELLQQEMALFPQWFVTELLAVQLEEEDKAVLDKTFTLLVESALEQPQVVVHRDYHSRNLLWRGEEAMGVVDFQDGVVGPLSYDLVSLLKDCYIRWPAPVVAQRALAYLKRCPQLSQGGHVTDDQLLQWFDWMGLQRHIKVLGIFARLWLRDGKAGYLKDLPLVIRYTLEVAGRYPQLRPFNEWFHHRLLPVLPEQPWYQPWEQAGE